MNVYMMVDENTGRTGTCLDISEFSKILNITKYKLLKGGSGYKAVKLGGSKLRREYKTIDDVYSWFQKNTGKKMKAWRHKEFYVTAYDIKKEQRNNEEAVLNMIEQTKEEYGSNEELEKQINMSTPDYIEEYYKDLIS